MFFLIRRRHSTIYYLPVCFITLLTLLILFFSVNNNIVTGDGDWFFDSDSIDIKFENPKFSTSVKGTFDTESNTVTCKVPPLITEETMAPLAELENQLAAALEELGEDGDVKKITKVRTHHCHPSCHHIGYCLPPPPRVTLFLTSMY